jgi:hypothetical protein
MAEQGEIIEHESEFDGLSIEEMIDLLSKEALAEAFAVIELRRKGKKVSKVREDRLIEMQNDLKNIEKIYTSCKKMNRVGAKKESQQFDRDIAAKIRDKFTTTLGDIVVAKTDK